MAWTTYLLFAVIVYGVLMGGALAYKLHQHGKTIRALADWTGKIEKWQTTILDDLTKPSRPTTAPKLMRSRYGGGGNGPHPPVA